MVIGIILSFSGLVIVIPASAEPKMTAFLSGHRLTLILMLTLVLSVTHSGKTNNRLFLSQPAFHLCVYVFVCLFVCLFVFRVNNGPGHNQRMHGHNMLSLS